MMKIGALFLRGAVAIDDLHYSENFVYGNALLKTHKLESHVAKYPRIVIDASILNIINATQAYIFKYNINKDIRFDIISIIPTLDGNFEIEHQEDAFFPPIGR